MSDNTINSVDAIAKAKIATLAAKDKYLKAQSDFDGVNHDDADAVAAAKKAVISAGADYAKKAETEMQTRIGAAGADGYVAEKNEQNLYHVQLDKPTYNHTTGEKISKEYVQKFTVAEWRQFGANCAGLGYTIHVMWDPIIFNY